MTNNDSKLIINLKTHIDETKETLADCKQKLDKEFKRTLDFEHPLDSELLKKIDEISIQDSDDEYKIFQYIDTVKEIWKLAIEKSIKCLRFFDSREPFLDNDSKHPVAYGVDDLRKYYDNSDCDMYASCLKQNVENFQFSFKYDDKIFNIVTSKRFINMQKREGSSWCTCDKAGQ